MYNSATYFYVPEWWNGIHGRFKIFFLHGIRGSNPLSGTTFFILFKNKQIQNYYNKIYCTITKLYFTIYLVCNKKMVLHSCIAQYA